MSVPPFCRAGRVRQSGGIVEIFGKAEVRVKAFEEPGKACDVGLGFRQYDDPGCFQVRGSGLCVVHLGVDRGEAVLDGSARLFE